MQQLHLVGFTTDHDSLIFSGRKGAKSGGFVLPLDEALLATIAEAVRRRLADGEELEVPQEILAPVAPPPRRQSQLSPREIQDRLRAGRSLETIAAEAGVGEEWVGRFAAPVEAERSQIVGRARELVYAKPRRGDSAESLGLAVRWNLADRGVRLTNDEYDAGWTAYQVADHTWMVTFTFVSRRRAQEAEWEVDLATGELVSRNRLASDLGYVEPGRRRRSLASLQPMPLLGTKGARRPGAPMAPRPADVLEEDEEAPPQVRAAATTKAAKTAKASKVAKPATKATGKATGKAAATKAAGKAAKATGKPAIRPRKAATAAGKATTKATRKATKATAKATGKATKVAKPAIRPRKASRVNQPVKSTRAPAKTPPVKRAPAKKAGATRAKAAPRRAPAAAKRAVRTARTSTSRPRGARGQEAPPPVAAPAAERPAPNELGQRRLQLATGAPRPSNAGRRPSTGAPAPAPPRMQPARPAAPVRISAARSTDASAGAPPPNAPRIAGGAAGARPAEPAPPTERPPSAPVPPTAAPPRDRPPVASGARSGAPPRERPAARPAPILDVESEASAEARRAERRRARAEARAAAGAAETSTPTPAAGPASEPSPPPRARPSPPQPAPPRPAADVPAGDGRVVTIRANRVTPPRAVDETGDVIVDGDRPPLRPAQPAAQPRRRRFSRTTR